MSQRSFELTFMGVINDPESTLSDSNLRLNLAHIIQEAMSNGLITGDTSAELDDYSVGIVVNEVK